MSNSKKSFIVYYDNEVIVGHLPDEEAGMLFKALFPFAKDRIKPEFIKEHSALTMAFDIISMSIIRNDEKYYERCERNRENGRKGGLAKASNSKQSLANAKQGLANLADRDKDRERDKDRDKDRDSINYQLIADMYNATCVSFPRLTKLSEKRKKAIRARLKSYTMDDFKRLFEMAEASSFLRGQNSRNWSATFDWLIADGNMAKVLDGNYSDSGTRQQASQPDIELPEYYKLLGKREPSPDDPFQ